MVMRERSRGPSQQRLPKLGTDNKDSSCKLTNFRDHTHFLRVLIYGEHASCVFENVFKSMPWNADLVPRLSNSKCRGAGQCDEMPDCIVLAAEQFTQMKHHDDALLKRGNGVDCLHHSDYLQRRSFWS